MASAAFELQKAVFAALRDDEALREALGGPRVYDAAPADVPFPYLTLGRTGIYDWSTATEEGSEHLLTLDIWSKGRGKKQAFALIELVSARLVGAALPLDGYRLVNFVRDYAEVRYEDDLDLHHGILRMRAFIEVAA